MNFKEKARAFKQSLQDIPRAIFYVADEFKSVEADGVRFKRLAMDAPNSLVGVYDKRCSVGMLVDDMEYMAA